MPELEFELAALAESIDWPPTPDPPHFSGELADRRSVARVPRRIPRWALAAAALLLIAVTLAFSWLGLHTTIYRLQNPPTPIPRSPGVLGSNLGLGTPTTLSDAQRQVQWTIAVPSRLGRPDAVYLRLPSDGGPSGGEVSLVYANASGVSGTVLITEARGAVNENFFLKILGPDTNLETVTVNGRPGYWISGHPHDFAFTDANGDFYMEQMRLAANTLVFDDRGTIVRIEGNLTKAQAVAIAGTL